MHYRVYDKKDECWVRENIYLSFNKDLLVAKKSLFNTLKLSLASDRRFILQESIELKDKKKRLIFEGDIVKVETTNEDNKTTTVVTGVVAYYPNHAAFYLFDYQNSKYYPITSDITKYMEIIGNVIENKDLLPEEGK